MMLRLNGDLYGLLFASKTRYRKTMRRQSVAAESESAAVAAWIRCGHVIEKEYTRI